MKRNNDFLGRDSVLKEIHQILNKEYFLILNGPVGVGKKSYALEYCNRNSKKFFWFCSGNKNSIIEGIAKYSHEEGLGNEESEFCVLYKRFLEFIKNAMNLILFFSDVESKDEYESILKLIDFRTLKVPTIITTNCYEYFDHIKIVKITPFTPEECGHYLKSNLPNELSDKIEILCRSLKSQNIQILPVKLAQIRNILRNEPKITTEKLLFKLNNKEDYLFYTIFQNLSLKSRDAMLFLRFIRFLNPDYIVGKILKNLPLKEHLLNILDTLTNQHLCQIVSYNSPRFGISMHRIVQQQVETYLEINKLDKRDENVRRILISVLNTIFPKITFEPNDSWIEAENIFFHLTKFLDSAGFNKPTDDLVELYHKVSNYSIYKQFNCEIYFEYATKAVQLRQIINNNKFSDSINYSISLSCFEIGNSYLKNKNYEKALELFEKSLYARKDCLIQNKSDALKIYNCLAETYFGINNSQQVVECDLECLKIIKTFNMHVIVYADTYYRLSISYKNLHNHSKALKFCLKYLKLSKFLNVEDKSKIGECLNNAANLYKFLGDETRSFNYLLKYYKLQKTFEDFDYDKVAKIAYELGLKLSVMNQHEKALKYKNESLKYWLSVLTGENLCVAKILNSIATSQSALGLYKEALESSLKSLNIKQILYKDDNKFVAQSLHNTGVIYSLMQQENDALEYKFKCLKMRENLFGYRSSSVAKSLYSIGFSYFQQNDFERALELYFKCLDIIKSIISKPDDQLIFRLHNALSKVYEKIGNLNEFKKHKLSFLEYQLKFYENKNQLRTAQTLFELGMLEANLLKSLKYFLNCIEICNRMLKKNDTLIIKSIDSMNQVCEKIIKNKILIDDCHDSEILATVGKYCIEKKKYNESIDYLLKALDEIPNEISNGKEKANCFYLLGIAYSNLNEHKLALENKFECLRLLQTHENSNETKISKALYSIAVSYSMLGNFNSSLEYDLKCLHLREKIFKTDHPELAASLNGVGSSYSNLGEDSKALEYKLKALEMRKRLYNGKHSEIVDSLLSVALTYQKLGDKKSASKYHLESKNIKNQLTTSNFLI